MIDVEALSAAKQAASELAVTLGQPAMEATLLAARVDALGTILRGSLALAVLFFAVVLIIRFSKWLDKQLEEDDGKHQAADVFAAIIVYATLGAVGLISFVETATKLFNAIAWASLFYPEVWLVSKILDKV